jgi:hypothetical protein
MLLPLRSFEGSRRMREDVRDAEVCFAMVGRFLCAPEEQGFEPYFEDGAALSSTWTLGARGD